MTARASRKSRASRAIAAEPDAAAAIDARTAAVGGWRGETLARMRALVLGALPGVVEAMKWKKPSNPAGTPTWESPGGGILCVGDAFKDKVKITFGAGATLDDPHGVFNASLGGNAMRAIDLAEGDAVDAAAFQALVRAADAQNRRRRA